MRRRVIVLPLCHIGGHDCRGLCSQDYHYRYMYLNSSYWHIQYYLTCIVKNSLVCINKTRLAMLKIQKDQKDDYCQIKNQIRSICLVEINFVLSANTIGFSLPL